MLRAEPLEARPFTLPSKLKEGEYYRYKKNVFFFLQYSSLKVPKLEIFVAESFNNPSLYGKTP
jgi:hypothetical protein